LQVIITKLVNLQFPHLKKLNLGITRTHVSDDAMSKLCEVLKTSQIDEVFIGISGNKLTKAFTKVLIHLASTASIKKLKIFAIMIPDWDRADYDSIVEALRNNEHLTSGLLNNDGK
jgi:hypothetical protein